MTKHLPFLFILTCLSSLSASSNTPPPPTATQTASFKPFTGKVLGYKVRLRTKPDLESYILCQLNKNDLLMIVGEENDFWIAKPPKNTKAYVFRSYVIDQVIEANRVNVRINPNTEAPIIGQLQKGDRIDGTISSIDSKWLEITPPDNAGFYIAKEFIGYAGTYDYLEVMEKKKEEVNELLNTAYLMTEAECKKPFDQMAPEKAISLFEQIIEKYPEFDDCIVQSKEGLALLQDSYLQKKLTYLEEKADLSQDKAASPSFPKYVPPRKSEKEPIAEKLKGWGESENVLYQRWSTFHPAKSMDDFYKEQKVNSIVLKGTIKPFDQQIKNKPGNFILETNQGPVGYLYSTQIDLEKWNGKEVSIVASPRSNNHFAFPAYYVFEVK